MEHDEDRTDLQEDDGHPAREGLPGETDDNHEEHEPTQPTRRRPSEAEGGDPDAGGESSEGSQSTGNPNSAG